MNVLSLFDGISAGKLALERAGIKVDKYFAAEIDKNAIQISKKNHPNIIHLGDVKSVKSESLPKIDLLIGGSPCQGFSFAGKQLNFEDERSKLFFEYVRLLKELKPTYFLLENVVMKQEYQDVISDFLGVKPVKINSSLLSAQNRKRLYWCNWGIKQPEDKNILLEDILESERDWRPIGKWVFGKWKNKTKIDGLGYLSRKKSFALTTKGTHPSNYYLLEDNSMYTNLTPLEWERLQTFPDNYTQGVSNTQRYKMLGNSWTVDIISWIFECMEVK